MKRLLTAVALLVGFIFNANAQTTDDPSQLNVSNDRFFINGMPLNDGEILDLLGEDIYNNEYLDYITLNVPPVALSIVPLQKRSLSVRQSYDYF